MRTRLLMVGEMIALTAITALAQTDQEESIRALDERFSSLAEKARAKETADRRFTETCGGTVNDVTVAVLPRCQSYLSDSRRLEGELRTGMESVEETARRAGVYPGTVRELRRRYNL